MDDDIDIDNIEVEIDLADIEVSENHNNSNRSNNSTNINNNNSLSIPNYNVKSPIKLKLSSHKTDGPSLPKISPIKPGTSSQPLSLTPLKLSNLAPQSQLVLFQNNYQRHDIPIEITFQLISETQFSCMGCKNEHINSIFKNISNSHVEQYDGVDWWMFPVNSHDELAFKLKNIPKLILTTLPIHILDSFRKYEEKRQAFENFQVDLSRLPITLLNTLLPFQRIGVEYGIKKEGKLLIADEMGLGKTIQALSIAYYYKDEWPLLIVTPSSLKLTWYSQIEKFLFPHVEPEDINVIMNGKGGLNGKINIISYDLVSKKFADITQKHFNVVIADESHFIKHFAATRTKAIAPILQASKRTILLTGTPALSRPSELFTQINCIKPWFQRWPMYGLRYCAGFSDKFGMNYNGHSNMRELNLFLQTFMIRRRKDEVLTELPELRREVIKIPLDKKSLKKIKKTLDDIKKEKQNIQHAADKKTSFSAKGTRSSLFLKLYRDTGLYKLASIKKLLGDRIESIEGKFIIFAHHTNVIDGICEFLNELKLEYVKIDGRTKVHARNEFVELFQTQENIKVAVLSITAAGVGLTLTKANLVIFAELFWNPGSLLQAEARAHRYGQTQSVLVQYLVSVGTVDETIWNFIDSKINTLGQVLDGEQGHELGVENSNLNIDVTDPSMDDYIQEILDRVEETDRQRKIKIDKLKEKRRQKLLEYPEENNLEEDDEEFYDEEDQDEEENVNKKAKKKLTSTTKSKSSVTYSNNNNNSNGNNNKLPNLKRKETTDLNDTTKKRKSNPPTPQSTSIEVDLEEDYEDLTHLDISKFSSGGNKDEESLDAFIFQPKK